MKITYYVASSIDGYIAREDGDVSWLDELGISPEESGYYEFLSTVDGIVMGRNTYDMILSFGSWPYGEKPTWVCTTRGITAVDGCNLQSGKTPNVVYNEAKHLGISHLWLVGGGILASSFLEKKYLNRLIISQMPIILGGGIRLFGELQKPLVVRSTATTLQKAGFTQMEFLIK